MTLATLLDSLIRKMEGAKRRRSTSGESVFLIDKRGKVVEHYESTTTVTRHNNTVTTRSRRRINRIIQP